MQKFNLKTIALLLGLSLPIFLCQAEEIHLTDGFSHIAVKESHVQGIPKGTSIQASISGHYLMVSFIENLGEVSVEITTPTGDYVQANSCITPNGLMFYIPLAGDYIVYFTLPNGDEYYGEFTVTD